MNIILHLSDLHFGWDGNSENNKANREICLNSLLDEISELDESWRPTVICITGDLGWHGAKKDYEEAQRWLKKLLEQCNLKSEHLVICPGNHDSNRIKARKIARPSLAKEADEVLELPLEGITTPFSNYVEFYKGFGIPALTCGKEEMHLIGQRIIGNLRFVVLNSAWFSKGDDDNGKLWLGLPHIRSLESYKQLPIIKANQKDLITIAMAHHPKDWFHPDEFNAFEARPNTIDYLAKRCNILLTGHTHSEVRNADKIAESAWHFTSGATYAGASHFNAFRLLKVDANQIIYKTFEFDPRSSENRWKSSNALSLQLHDDIKPDEAFEKRAKKKSQFNVRDKFRKEANNLLEQKSRLLKPIGQLPKITKQRVSLQVSTQHQNFDENKRQIREKDAERSLFFYDAVREARNTLLFGDLGSGKSTLAAQLVIETMDRDEHCTATIIPVKSLILTDRFGMIEFLQSINRYVTDEILFGTHKFELESLLDEHSEVLLVFDGLDELERRAAASMLRQAIKLSQHWPTIQIVATARPVELTGISYADWNIVHSIPLTENIKQNFIQEELIADGHKGEELDQKTREKLQVLKDLPSLNAIASTPLAIRLICSQIESPSSSHELTLGDLLYKLLIDQVGNWQTRDDKPSNFEHFEESFPTAESKAELFAELTPLLSKKSQITLDEAKETIKRVVSSHKNKHHLVEEALEYFEWLGLIRKSDFVECPLQPMLEIATAFGLLVQKESSSEKWKIPNNTSWRIVSFAAAIARRQGCFPSLRNEFVHYIKEMLLESKSIPAACYIVVESRDIECAKKTVHEFYKLGHNPLTVFHDERSQSTRNIAKTLWLAGETGFDWFYNQYLDPRFPLPERGSFLVSDLFTEWGGLALSEITEEQKNKLKKMVTPLLAINEGNLFGALNILSMLVPEEFRTEDRLWFQSQLLDSTLFSEKAIDKLLNAGRDNDTRELVNHILYQRATNSLRSCLLWFELNNSENLPLPIIRSAFRYITQETKSIHIDWLIKECRNRFGENRWLRFARWYLVAGERSLATAAAINLYQGKVEQRLSVIGDALLDGMHDGGYIAEAESIFKNLIKQNGEQGIRWIASKILECNDLNRPHSGWWRIFLDGVESLEDGPNLLANCVENIGPFLIPRYPEVRRAFASILSGSKGKAFRDALKKQLNDLTPRKRRGAGIVLLVTAPQSEGEALFVAINARIKDQYPDWDEWEKFCLTLNFGPSVLSFLNNNLHLLEPYARTFALVLLEKNKFEIKEKYYSEHIQNLLDFHNWRLLHDSDNSSVLHDEKSYQFLRSQLDKPSSKTTIDAADNLLRFHLDRLTKEEEIKCIALSTSHSKNYWKIDDRMFQIESDPEFAKMLNDSCQEIIKQGGNRPFLLKILEANQDSTRWKDVVWSMLCDTVVILRSGGEFGQTLLNYGRVIKKHQKYIGEAAKEFLFDPRLKENRNAESYHWLAVIADEFVGLTEDLLEETIKQGDPIYCSAVSALIARLGKLPEGVTFRKSFDKRPNLPGKQSSSGKSKDVIIHQLKEYSRNSETFHPELLSILEESLMYPIEKQTLSEIANIGTPGTLIAMLQRFVQNYPQNLAEIIQLWCSLISIPQTRRNEQSVKILVEAWIRVRDLILSDNKTSDKYLEELDKKLLDCNDFPLVMAYGILKHRGTLLNEQIPIIFSEYIKHSSSVHEELFKELIKWLNRDLEEKVKSTILDATNDALIALNESQWNSSDLFFGNTYAYLLFPIIQWIHGKDNSDIANSVFLRGLGKIFDAEPDRNHHNKMRFFTILEPVMKKVPKRIIRSLIQEGLNVPNPSARIFCYMINSLSEEL